MAKYDYEQIEHLLKKYSQKTFKERWELIGDYYYVNPETVRKWHYREKRRKNGNKNLTKVVESQVKRKTAFMPPKPIKPEPIKPIKQIDLVRRSSEFWRTMFFLVTGKDTKGRIKVIVRSLITYLEGYLLNLEKMNKGIK